MNRASAPTAAIASATAVMVFWVYQRGRTCRAPDRSRPRRRSRTAVARPDRRPLSGRQARRRSGDGSQARAAPRAGHGGLKTEQLSLADMWARRSDEAVEIPAEVPVDVC